MRYRRNYDSVFHGIQKSRELMNSTSFRLSLIGMGALHIPEDLQEKVQLHTHLPYRVCAVPVKMPRIHGNLHMRKSMHTHMRAYTDTQRH